MAGVEGEGKPFLDQAISKLHEAQSLMLKARLRDENDPRLRCVAIERNKWYEKYVELEWNKQDSTAAYALSNTGIS